MIIEKQIDIIEYIKNSLTEKKNIFVAHSISNDWALGKGVAKLLDREFSIKKYYYNNFEKTKVTDVFCTNTVFSLYNLITKEHFWDKPTYDSITDTLVNLKISIIENKLNNYELIMPRIGCGLDKLDWAIIKSIIEDILLDTVPNITICFV